MTLNRNSLPFDANGPWYTSGLRLGTPAVTTLGMGTDEMDEIAAIAVDVLRATTPVSVNGKPSKARFETEPKVEQEARARAAALCDKFPVYPEIDLSIL
jgi:glycine hydroxymethyltransferase